MSAIMTTLDQELSADFSLAEQNSGLRIEAKILLATLKEISIVCDNDSGWAKSDIKRLADNALKIMS